jgi:predicted ATPase/DNA-binding winged helix-turn-helix (wHTH) protein
MESSLGRSMSFGSFRLYPGARLIENEGSRVALGSRALDILIALANRAGEVVTHRELTQRVWRGLVVTPGSLRVHISALRKALGDSEAAPRYIVNVPGQGYCFVAPITHTESPSDVSIRPSPRPAEPESGESSTEQPARPRHNLPNQLTSFIGREKEIRELKGLLASTRLLTLSGSGGCGKSRLALQVATEVLDTFPDGCWSVELAPLDEPALVAQAVANALGIEEQGSGPLPTAIANHLANKRVLLVLDNAEHLIEPCAYLADLLLRRCGALEILVTSREPLSVGGELTYRVPSLSLPKPTDVTVEAVMACECARLFVERARLHRLEFEVTEKNVQTLTSICRRLDGIALAIELAAPRVRTMSIEELNRHLGDRFGMLTSGHRMALPRHRALRSLIDWSHDLLTTGEKTVLRRVAVFPGGVTVDAAEFVCTEGGIGRGLASDLLTSLTDKSILIAEPRDELMRFGMLETVREYALDRLRESGEEEAIRERHLKFFLAMAEAFSAERSEEQRGIKLKRLDQELDNVRAAFAWCDADVERAVTGMRLAGKLAWFWATRSYFTEGRDWIERFLAATPGGEGDEDRAKALATAGTLAQHQSDFATSDAYHRDAIAVYERLGQRREVGGLLGNLGALAVHQGRLPEARELLGEALAVARETDDRRLIAMWLYNLGVLACNVEDFEQARVVMEECVAVSRDAGKWSLAGALQQLGWVRHAQGQRQEALSLLMESLQLHREFEDKVGIANTLYHLAMVSHDNGDFNAAKAQLQEALALQQTVGDRVLTASVLEVLACLTLEFGSLADAARLWGGAQRLRAEIESPQDPMLRRRCEKPITAAREGSQDSAAFDVAWREGRAMSLEAVLRFAMNL